MHLVGTKTFFPGNVNDCKQSATDHYKIHSTCTCLDLSEATEWFLYFFFFYCRNIDTHSAQFNPQLKTFFLDWGGNDSLGFLLGTTGQTSTMHLNDIPDEGEALTSNPLAKRRSRRAFKTNKPCNTRQLWKLFAVPKSFKKHRLYLNSYICRFSHHLSSFLCDLVVERWDLLCALLDVCNIVAVFFDIERTSLQIKFSATISFFVLLAPGLITSFPMGSGLCFNQSQELWGLQGLVFQNVPRLSYIKGVSQLWSPVHTN